MIRLIASVPGTTCLAVAVFLLAGNACTKRPTEIVVFHASSLSSVLGDVALAFQRENPGTHVRLEPSGSQVAARKVSELGMRADVILVADAPLIEKFLIPAHATWNAAFATNEVVIAHKDHSKWTDQIGNGNWPDILTREGVRLGRADPDTAPIGYQTLMVWQLAETSGKYGSTGMGLSAKLQARCSPDHVVHDETELLALLESRAIDYAFLFRSTAEDHHLKILGLPPEINLSRQDLAAQYATVSVEVRMKQGQGASRVSGAPVLYGLTIPNQAPHPGAAGRFVAFLLGESGQRLLLRRGFHPLRPAHCGPCTGLPTDLASLVVSGGGSSAARAP